MLLIIILGILAAIVGVACGMQLQKRHFQQEIQNAKATAEKLLNNANEDAKKQSAKIIADGKQQTIDYQDSIEEELDSYQADNVTRQTRIQQRETGLKQTESRLDQLHSKLADESHEINQQKAEIEQLHHTANDLSQERLKTLQERGSISLAEAKQQILDELKTALKREKDIELKYQDDEAQVNAPKMAKILADDAIQRGPVDMPREHIEHSVQINDNNTKQKLIGREASNIRYIESLTGTDLVFDPDDPHLLHVVTQDPLRREVAKTVITNLAVTKQINPQSIEHQVESAQLDLMNELRRTGEKVVGSLHIGWMHPDLLKIVGRLKYRTSYGQNVLNHSIEVADISGMLAAELGLNVKIAKRAGLLHDIGKAIDREVDGTHVELGVKIAETYGEDPQVINSIASHHGDVEVTTPIAHLVAAGDSISGGRPGARSESVEEYVNRLKNLERIASSKQGVKESYAIQAGREIRIVVDPKKLDDQQNQQLANEVKDEIENELTYPGKIKVTSIRDFKAVAYVGAEKKKVHKRLKKA
ncbi:ribonuclease Y [Lentilactobacillus buchneri]|uniref:Ribonuclease Y n=1 Tax=Lentilactobacillus buchneri DSM 20057 TaxID=1423728 RepID=A0A4R5NQJ4_LENBU|nr:ribonuclease Y [Lentilactobacillus buchneri]AEB72746.1 2,3 cyclic-nucleotide 2-phosphodiesterase [Lentilactobacillus buchneri NRRL B-30929]MCT2881172.1 ribonuclease Y [Lentilactobacillus buchneri]MCT2898364.1 ribonuclease Y [Lentilactobacillus buchneri]MCT3251948.1 ribonuclease Y [Lentilactobacillus buchneri]MCT3546536.1 ribonuclease Y [Lentilactobacillus buchneri]